MKERNKSIELFRIIAMLMVTTLHALGHGGVLEQYDFGTPGYVFFYFIETFCNVAVNGFVLITGYFMVKSEFKISRVIKLLLQVEFFSVICLIFAKFLFHVNIGLKGIMYTFLPFTSNTYWFVSAYIILIILAPILNILIHSINKQQHLLILFALTILFSIIPTFCFWSRDILGNGYNFVWFIVLYFTAAYIRFYGNTSRFSEKSYKYLIKNICFIWGGTASILIIGYISSLVFGEPKGEKLLLAYNSIITFPASIYLFMAFRNIEIKNNTVIKISVSLGSLCFGAYLLTDHPLIRESLWNAINFSQYASNGFSVMFIHLLSTVMILFIVGCLVEYFRKKLFTLMSVDKLAKFIDDKFISLKEYISGLSKKI